jgi:hypothetical protein
LTIKNLVKNQINSSLNSEMKELFLKKLETFYLCKLKDSLYKLTDLFEREKSLKDE